MINWKVRIKNKNFWLGIIPAIILLVKEILAIFGIGVDLTMVEGRIVEIINTLFMIMSILGIITDPTTEGLSDSYRAMGYTEPYPKIKS